MQSQVGPDSVVAGRYTLERCINTGGIGSLWRARDEQTGRPCAMRLADGTGHNIFELAARYRAEVDIIERIRCENVLDIFDYGDWNDMPYLVVEHVEGEDLATRLRRERHLSPELAYRLLAQTARALARAHAVGIVHGDVTPENILIAAEGMQSVAKLYNFSLTQRGSEVSVGTVTKVGSYLRLPYYASPEQAAGKSIDWRSDLWSLGVLGYECLTGKKPFESNVFGDLVGQILCEPIPPLVLPGTDTPPELQDWWEKACARDLDKRFQSAKEMSDALGQTFAFQIVFVPDALASAASGSSSSMPAVVLPSANEEPRVGVRRKSVPKMARQSTQIGLGAENIKVPSPTPIPVPVVERAPVTEEAPRVGVRRTSVPKMAGHSTQIGLGTENFKVPSPTPIPAPVIESATVIESAPVEVPAPVTETEDLAEDLFEGFQTSEAPTLAFRQAEAPALVEEEFSVDIVDSQRVRTKSLRRMVTLIVALLLAFVLIPLGLKLIIDKHKKPIGQASPLVMAPRATDARIDANLPNAPAESVAGLAQAPDSVPAAVTSEPEAKSDSMRADASVAEPASSTPDSSNTIAKSEPKKKAAKVSPIAAESARKSSTQTLSGKSHSVPAAAHAKPTPPAAASALAPAPKPAKGKTTRDYGI